MLIAILVGVKLINHINNRLLLNRVQVVKSGKAGVPLGMHAGCMQPVYDRMQAAYQRMQAACWLHV